MSLWLERAHLLTPRRHDSHIYNSDWVFKFVCTHVFHWLSILCHVQLLNSWTYHTTAICVCVCFFTAFYITHIFNRFLYYKYVVVIVFILFVIICERLDFFEVKNGFIWSEMLPPTGNTCKRLSQNIPKRPILQLIYPLTTTPKQNKDKPFTFNEDKYFAFSLSNICRCFI